MPSPCKPISSLVIIFDAVITACCKNFGLRSFLDLFRSGRLANIVYITLCLSSSEDVDPKPLILTPRRHAIGVAQLLAKTEPIPPGETQGGIPLEWEAPDAHWIAACRKFEHCMQARHLAELAAAAEPKLSKTVVNEVELALNKALGIHRDSFAIQWGQNTKPLLQNTNAYKGA